MYKIVLDKDLYLKNNGTSWSYVSKDNATTFDTQESAQAYMQEEEIRFIAPNAVIEKGV
jgi:hypothetical protein